MPVTKPVETKTKASIQAIVAGAIPNHVKKFVNLAILLSGPRTFGRVGFLLVCFHLSTSPSLAQSVISTLAGNGTFGFGGDGGPAVSAAFRRPSGVAVDGLGNVYIADRDNNRIRKVTPAGIITTIAGTGTFGFSGDGGPATSAQLNGPRGLAMDAQGNLFIADAGTFRIRKVTPGGIISTVAGSGQPHFSETGNFSGDGGPATSAVLDSPVGVAVDAVGNLYIADTFDLRVRKVTTDGVITTVAGTGIPGFSGDGGPATSASLFSPCGVAVDAAGNIYIADCSRLVRKVSPDGVISTVAGSLAAGTFIGDGGPATSAGLSTPAGVAVDAAGNIFIADFDNSRIRMVDVNGTITTVAGNGTSGFSGDGGPPISARLAGPVSVAVDADGRVYISDRGNNRVRKTEFVLTSPTLASIVPDIGTQGTIVNVTLSGDSFFPPIEVDAMDPDSGITAGNVVITSLGTLRTTFTIASNAVPGPRNITVKTNLGTSGTVTFSVVAPPTLASISPLSGDWGASPTITLSGTGFRPGMSVNVGAEITISNVNVLNSTSATATFAIAAGATTGARNISVTVIGATSNATNFIVNSVPPTITGIGPVIGRRGSKVFVSLTGTNFVSPLIFAPVGDIGISNVIVSSATTASALFSVGPGATLGDRTFDVTSPGGSSNTPTFKVFPSGQQDFNGDGDYDILWYNAATGQTSVWLMNGLNMSSNAALLTDANWKVTGTADLNGDGKSDLLWYNAVTGQTSAWLMNGTSVMSTATLLTDPDWKVIASADLNGDGKSDLIWRNAATGETAGWLMNGLSVSSFASLLTDPKWMVIATANLNGNGKPELIWYNAVTGQTDEWFMNGLSRLGFVRLLTSPDWKVTGVGDFNGDGRSDLLWYNAATGETAAWLWRNGFIDPPNFASLLTDPNWKVTAISDLNGDTKADLIWYNAATGETAAWLMNGLIPSSNVSLLSDPGWKVTDTPDLSGDGKSGLLWYNAPTGQTSAWLLNGTSVSAFAPLLTDSIWKPITIAPGKTTNSP